MKTTPTGVATWPLRPIHLPQSRAAMLKEPAGAPAPLFPLTLFCGVRRGWPEPHPPPFQGRVPLGRHRLSRGEP
eukprot:8703747-Lingulodinium_polyedra.AAC.1